MQKKYVDESLINDMFIVTIYGQNIDISFHLNAIMFGYNVGRTLQHLHQMEIKSLL